jgi:hypothetical protein
MSNANLKETPSGPTVAVFGEYCDALLYFIESLLTKFCKVRIYSFNPDNWIVKTNHINKDSPLGFHPLSKESSFENADYIVCSVIGPSGTKVKKQAVDEAMALSSKYSSKTYFFAPLIYFDKETPSLVEYIRKRNLSENLYAQTIFIGETYGPRMDVSPLRFSEVAQNVACANFVSLERRVFYPVFLPDLAKSLVILFFSFGPPAEEVAIYNSRLGEGEVSRVIFETFGLKAVTREDSSNVGVFELKKSIKTETSFKVSLVETVNWLKKNRTTPVISKKAVAKVKKPPRIKVEPRNKNLMLVAVIAACLLLALPFCFLGASAGSLALAVTNIKNSKVSRAEFLLKTSSRMGTLGEDSLSYASTVPLIGAAFEPFYKASGLLKDAAGIGLDAIDVISAAQELGSKVLGSEVYDPYGYTQKMSTGLERIYQDTGFLQGELNSQKGLVAKLFNKTIKGVDMEGLRAQTLLLRDVALGTPEMLGKNGQKSYLILFQNNMELRPTGGFIGSYAIITFSGGRLSDINVQDVYSADGQLKGHVEPPEPIKQHLGEANWFLRDSNWDPDFPTSASRAEWFLGKEIGTSVDGVISIDLEVAKSMLKVTGPIFLTDFNQRVDSDNLYEVTQKEVEEEFFPGSTKKASFLTALARQLINELTTQKARDPRLATDILLQNLRERHIQLFLHQRQVQRAISSMGFDGSVMVPSCTGNCHAGWLGVVEANFGVNKANYFVDREMFLKVELGDKVIKNQLVINYKNNANPALGVSGRYKTYVRLLLPIEGTIENSQLLTGQETTPLTADVSRVEGRQEAGFLIEILPGQGKSLGVSWSEPSNLSYAQQGEYRLYWRKQAGTGQNPISVQIQAAGVRGLKFTPSFSLTGQGNFIYNTTLARDLFSRISW